MLSTLFFYFLWIIFQNVLNSFYYRLIKYLQFTDSVKICQTSFNLEDTHITTYVKIQEAQGP